MLRREMKIHARGCPLNMLFCESKLREWLTYLIHEKDLATLFKLCVINSWLAPFFGDDVVCGLNDYSEEAKFYHDIGTGSAHVLDIMLGAACSNASTEEMILPAISQWFSTMRSLQSRNHGISLCDQIDFFSRSQLVFWLANYSTPQKRRILAEVLDQVVEHHEAMAAKAQENKSWPCSLFGATYRVTPINDVVVNFGPALP